MGPEKKYVASQIWLWGLKLHMCGNGILWKLALLQYCKDLQLVLKNPFLVMSTCVFECLSSLVCLMSEGGSTTRGSQPVVWRWAGWVSPLCERIQSVCKLSFGLCLHDTWRDCLRSEDMTHIYPFARLRSVWRWVCLCCVAEWNPNVDLTQRSSAVTWTCPCRDIHGSLAYRAGKLLDCRRWRIWQTQRPWRMQTEEPVWHHWMLTTWRHQHRESKHRGSRYTLLLTAVEKHRQRQLLMHMP